MAKKTTSKSKDPNRKVVLSDGTVIRTTQNAGRNLRKGKGGQERKKAFSTELGRRYEDFEVEDDYDTTLKYPPPSRNPFFREFWAASLNSIVDKPTFQVSHLGLYEVYCRLRVELRALDAFVAENGHTVEVITVAGATRKTYPEVHERMKAITMLGKYAQLLDLAPQKAKRRRGEDPDDVEEWT